MCLVPINPQVVGSPSDDARCAKGIALGRGALDGMAHWTLPIEAILQERGNRSSGASMDSSANRTQPSDAPSRAAMSGTGRCEWCEASS